jgi:hypothetical protein
VRLLARLLVAAMAAALPVALALTSCGTDAVGVTACQQIELARCQLAPSCTPGFDVTRCELFYRDECENGIQNADAGGNLTTQAAPCVAALKAEVACIDAEDSGACQTAVPSGTLCQETDAAATACSVILSCPEVLAACAYLATPIVDAGVDADADTDDAADAADASD